ncbi:hypothetical protein EV426DRAFT_588920 [Tirmania nivea]|nr:hypothetical protein EV426DRAFT_588920 [Tirmania nivea]
MPTYFTFPEPKPDARPSVPRSTHSFSRFDSSHAQSIRSNTLKFELDPNNVSETVESLEASDDEDDGSPLIPDPLPEGWDELPSEIVTLCDKFLDSLKQKHYAIPITGEHLSDLYQGFYNVAFEHIQIHINSLYLALSSKKKKMTGGGPETQMLSISEISQKKKDRRMLAAKKFALEESVERKVTGAVYEKIWRHRSTDDEARDESLRSKRETLKVVGVGLGHLGVAEVEDEDMIEALGPAREALFKMTDMQSPIAKLGLLRQSHKEIVDTLSWRNSDSSADRILPTLIFCLIHCPPAITVVSDLLFIQRFRMKKAVDGEAAYCLTNLEAAICFLETVDLATLKVDDTIAEGGTPNATEENDKPTSPQTSLTIPAAVLAAGSSTPVLAQSSIDAAPKRTASRGRKPAQELALAGSTPNCSESSSAPFPPTDDPLSSHAKIDHSLRVAEEAWEQEVARTPSPRASRFSDSAQQLPPKASLTPASPTAGGAEVVRNRALSYLTKNPVVDVAESVVMGADAGLKTIGDALGGSYKFLFGRMDEKKQEMPKTLEDARKLVEQPTTPGVIAPMEEGSTWDGNHPLTSPSPPPLPVRLGERERGSQSASPAAAFAAVETGLSRVVGIGSRAVMRGFARNSSNVSLDKEKDKALAEKSPTTIPQSALAPLLPATASASVAPTAIGVTGAGVVGKAEVLSPPPPVSDLLSAFPDLASPLLRQGKEAGAVPCVNERFMEVIDVGELKVGELTELLEGYKQLGAFVAGLKQS